MYGYLSKDGLYIDSSLNLIIIKIGFDKVDLNDLMIVNNDSDILDKLDIPKECILISPKYHSCINHSMNLIKINPIHMKMGYLDYIMSDAISDDIKKVVLEQLNAPNPVKAVVETKGALSKKDKVKRNDVIKKMINSITGVFMLDIVDILYSSEYDTELCNYLSDHMVDKSKIRNLIKEYLNTFGFHIFTDTTFEHMLIIKNIDNSFNCKTNRPLTIYADTNILGLVIGPKGRNVNKIKDDINGMSKYWVVPHMTVKDISERPDNSELNDSVEKFIKLIINMLKIRLILGVEND